MNLLTMTPQKLLIAFSALALCGSLAPAQTRQGTRDGTGGDTRCEEYVNLVGKITLAFKKIGQAEVQKHNPVLDVEKLWSIKRTPLKCVPVEKLDREARSNSKTMVTTLLAPSWEKRTPYKKLRLAIHELAVLAEYEGEGEYFFSDEMTEILLKYPSEIATMLKRRYELADQTIYNQDGSTTFLVPRVEVKIPGEDVLRRSITVTDTLSVEELGQVVCKFFGYSGALHAANGSRRRSREVYNWGGVSFSSKGYVEQTWATDDLVLATLTCAP
jgi:hypothetical protein